MKKTIIAGGVAAITLAIVGTAAAQTGEGRERGRDRAPVTQAQFVEQRVARLVAMDANNDGVVTRDEMRAAMQARMAEHRERAFTRLDADGDGAISRAEFDAARTHRGQRGDNANAERGERRGEWRRAGHRDGPRGHGRIGQGRMGHGPRLDGAAQDVNISEMRQRAEARFAQLDADGDGQLTAAEMRADREARRAEHRARRAQTPSE